MNAPHSVKTLLEMPDQQDCRVLRVRAPEHASEWQDWLQQIGFIAGEVVAVLLRSQPGGDPLAVRVGQATFALRRHEAAMIQVNVDAAEEVVA